MEHADKFLPKEIKEEGVEMGKLIMGKEDAEVRRRMQTRKWQQWLLIVSVVWEGKDNVVAIRCLLKMLDTFTLSIFSEPEFRLKMSRLLIKIN